MNLAFVCLVVVVMTLVVVIKYASVVISIWSRRRHMQIVTSREKAVASMLGIAMIVCFAAIGIAIVIAFASRL